MGKMKEAARYLDEFQEAYISCLLWTDESSEQELAEERGETWDEQSWDADMVRSGDWGVMREVLADFILSNLDDLREYEKRGRGASDAGYDFALSRNGHGTGFWDRGFGDLGDRLHAAAKVYGSENLSVCEDGSITVC